MNKKIVWDNDWFANKQAVKIILLIFLVVFLFFVATNIDEKTTYIDDSWMRTQELLQVSGWANAYCLKVRLYPLNM